MNQTSKEALQNYIRIIRDLTSTARQIARTEEAKTAAAAERRHALLDGCIQEEQALLLKLRGLEQHRTQLQKELGWESLTFRQILASAEPEQCTVLEPVFEELDQQMRRLQTARESSERILNVRLREIAHYTQMGSSYNNEGNAAPASSAPNGGRIRSTYV